MEIYVAICCDRHSDIDVGVFTTSEGAIEYAKNFMPESYELQEQKIDTNMKRAGWIYLADYGTEGDHVRVEKSKLDPPIGEG